MIICPKSSSVLKLLIIEDEHVVVQLESFSAVLHQLNRLIVPLNTLLYLPFQHLRVTQLRSITLLRHLIRSCQLSRHLLHHLLLVEPDSLLLLQVRLTHLLLLFQGELHEAMGRSVDFIKIGNNLHRLLVLSIKTSSSHFDERSLPVCVIFGASAGQRLELLLFLLGFGDGVQDHIFVQLKML